MLKTRKKIFEATSKHVAFNSRVSGNVQPRHLTSNLTQHLFCRLSFFVNFDPLAFGREEGVYRVYATFT